MGAPLDGVGLQQAVIPEALAGRTDGSSCRECKYSVSPSMSESALLVIAAGYVLCRPGLAGPSPSARVRPRTPPDNEWRDGGRVACAGAPAFTTSGCLLHRTAAVRRCRHLPGIIRCGLRTCMAGRARRRVRDTEGRIVYKLAHGGDYKYAPDH